MPKSMTAIAVSGLMLFLLSGCSDLKLSNNKVPEYKAGQQGHDITHQVTERDETNQAGAVGVAVSEVNTGTQPNPGKPNPNAGATTAVKNTSTQEIAGAVANSTNGVPQHKH